MNINTLRRIFPICHVLNLNLTVIDAVNRRWLYEKEIVRCFEIYRRTIIMTEQEIRRRKLLKTILAGFAIQAYGNITEAHYPPIQLPTTEKPVRLFNIHTKEALTIETNNSGLSTFTTLAQLNHFLRDHRENKVHAMDIKLLCQLCELQSIIGSDSEFEVIAGFRTRETNAMLRSISNNVAQRSYHLQGRAVDVRLPGIQTHSLRDAAISMQAGGVGYYAKSDFIHLDTGPVRYWSS